MAEALEWKAAIELQINLITESKRPMIPDSVDIKTISAILNMSSSTTSAWKRVALYEGVRVLEHITYQNTGCRGGSSGDNNNNNSNCCTISNNDHEIAWWMPYIMDPQYIASKKAMKQADSLIMSNAGYGAMRTRCHKAQLSVCSSPVRTFLTLMNSNPTWCWPSNGTMKVIHK